MIGVNERQRSGTFGYPNRTRTHSMIAQRNRRVAAHRWRHQQVSKAAWRGFCTFGMDGCKMAGWEQRLLSPADRY
jgi:hypothetical protein